MEGSVQLEYLMERIEVREFVRLSKRVEKAQKEINKKAKK